MIMLFTDLLRWWYTVGLRQRAKKIAVQLDGTIDYFSMDLLVKTLFAPFRQISAGKVNGSLDIQLRALIDRLFSRVIGAFIRILLLLVAVVAICLQAILSLLVLFGWLMLPVAPLIGLLLSLIGWTF